VLATLAAAALICVASALVGEALARALGLERSRGWSPGVGLAALMAIALAALKLPGHGTTAAVLVAIVVALAAWVVIRSGLGAPRWDIAALTGLTALAGCVPYIANGRFGILGLSFNNDLSSHLAWARALEDPDAAARFVPASGYPIGPHSLVATLSSATGIGLEEAFAGLLLALPVLIGWAALPLLDGLSRPRRLLAALLVAVAYALSAFYAQAGFKELALTLFLLGLLGIARAAARRASGTPARVGVQLGALGAGVVIAFSYGGLAWPVASLACWAALAAAGALLGGGGLARWLRSPRPAVPIGLYAAGTGIVLLAADLPRLIDSLTVFGASPSGTGALTNAGHLGGEISKREAFGFWPREDFRFGYEQTAVNELLGVLAVAVAVYGLVWWLWRRDFALPGAVAAAMAIAIYLSQTETPYTASKALAPAGALVMLMGARAVLAEPPIPRAAVRLALAAVAGAFVLGALWSSFLVLRGAQVGPLDHAEDLAELSPRIDGQPTLFLGSDDFYRAELPGVPLVVQPTDRPGKRWSYGDPFDFDSVESADLDEVRFAIAPRTGFQSDPPPNFRRVASAGAYELWERRGPTSERRILAEGAEPGKLLDCSTPAGRALARRSGSARVWPVAPRTRPFPAALRGVRAGGGGTTGIALPRGEWELSLQYTSPQAIDFEIDGAAATLSANLDRPGPYWRIGDAGLAAPGAARLGVKVEDDRLGAENHYASLLELAAVRSDAPHETVPLRRACGRYVDWYTLDAAPRGSG
jgi:hypothetical protein